MKCFGLTPTSVLERSAPTAINPPASLAFSTVYASLSFGFVSLLAYAIWAFRLVPGQAAMYCAIAAIYLGLSGLALSRLAIAPKIQIRFSLLFAIAFFVYALFWCLLWFTLKGKYHGDLWGSLLGLAAMTWFFQSAFGSKTDFLAAFAILFLFHSIGYYLGYECNTYFGGSTGRLLWGAAHGLGFGAGLGHLMFHCQKPLNDSVRNPD
jgi:lysylphosphatidylglycerol synthetase-like protein (DUF2156 family)